MRPTFFAEPADFRAWLEENHERAAELWVGFHKKASGRPSITWPEAVDEHSASAGSTGSAAASATRAT